MILSIALWAGLFSIPLALLFLIPRRTRRFAGLLLIFAVAMIVIAIFWPVTDHRVSAPTTHLDQAMPVWQFNERHSTRIHASPERVFEAIHAVTADDILFFRTLITIRRLGRPMTAGLQADKARKLHRAGVSKAEIARRLRIGRTSVRRILA